MTSDLEQIAEEMELSNAALSLNHFVKKNVGDPLEGHEASLWDLMCSNEKWAARIRAWIAANKESPQRKAFVEEADHLIGILICFEDKTVEMYGDAARDAFRTYRAWKEAEKVDNG